MSETPRFMVKADDDFAGLITVYVQCLPEDFDGSDHTDRWACYDYGKDGYYDRGAARTQAKARARTWCWEISKHHPCEWGTNWEGPR